MADAKFFRIMVVGGFGLVAVVGVVAFLWFLPKKVTIEYVGGTECVNVTPDPVEIWQAAPGNGLKKKRVKWKVTSSQKKQYRWEIAYDTSGSGGKPAATGDYLGQIDTIGCKKDDKNSTESKTSVPDKGKDVEWPYKITVYACDDGNQGDLLCVKDPVVWIRR